MHISPLSDLIYCFNQMKKIKCPQLHCHQVVKSNIFFYFFGSHSTWLNHYSCTEGRGKEEKHTTEVYLNRNELNWNMADERKCSDIEFGMHLSLTLSLLCSVFNYETLGCDKTIKTTNEQHMESRLSYHTPVKTSNRKLFLIWCMNEFCCHLLVTSPYCR